MDRLSSSGNNTTTNNNSNNNSTSINSTSTSTMGLGATSMLRPSTSGNGSNALSDTRRLSDNLAALLKNIGVSVLPQSTTGTSSSTSEGGGGASNSASTSTSNAPLPAITPTSSKKGGNNNSATTTNSTSTSNIVQDLDAQERNFWNSVPLPMSEGSSDTYRAMENASAEGVQLQLYRIFREISDALVSDRNRRRAGLLGGADSSSSATSTNAAATTAGGAIATSTLRPTTAPYLLGIGGTHTSLDLHASEPINWTADPGAPFEDTLLTSLGAAGVVGNAAHRSAFAVKPIVICDSVPLPLDCPPAVLNVSTYICI